MHNGTGSSKRRLSLVSPLLSLSPGGHSIWSSLWCGDIIPQLRGKAGTGSVVHLRLAYTERRCSYHRREEDVVWYSISVVHPVRFHFRKGKTLLISIRLLLLFQSWEILSCWRPQWYTEGHCRKDLYWYVQLFLHWYIDLVHPYLKFLTPELSH